MNLAIVIAGAGAGSRFGSDKLSEALAGATVLETAVGRMRRALPDAPVFAVVPPGEIERWRSALEVDEVLAGGPRRQDSVRVGVEAAFERAASHVVIHDAARPAVHPDDVLRLVDGLGDADGAILCSRPVDTVKIVDDADAVIETIARGVLRLAQTPQLFSVAALEWAWRQQGPEPEWSDESALLEDSGFVIRAIEAEHPNPKLTTRSELELIRLLVEDR